MKQPAPIDLDRLMTPEEFASWLGVKPEWVRGRGSALPGRIVESRKVVRFHPRTYLARRVK